MMKTYICYLFFLTMTLAVKAQDSLLLNRSFQFEDGIYLSFEDFKNNSPSFTPDKFDMVYVINPQTLLAQVASVNLFSEKPFNLSDVWGVCIDGRPYVQIDKEEVGKDLASFAGISIVGRLCFYSYKKPVDVPIEIKAYNPLNGQPFRTAMVSRTELRQYNLVLDFLKGEVRTFSKPNLLEWVGKDPQISRLVRSLEPGDGETLMRALIAFNDRNLLFIKK